MYFVLNESVVHGEEANLRRLKARQTFFLGTSLLFLGRLKHDFFGSARIRRLRRL